MIGLFVVVLILATPGHNADCCFHHALCHQLDCFRIFRTRCYAVHNPIAATAEKSVYRRGFAVTIIGDRKKRNTTLFRNPPPQTVRERGFES